MHSNFSQVPAGINKKGVFDCTVALLKNCFFFLNCTKVEVQLEFLIQKLTGCHVILDQRSDWLV